MDWGGEDACSFHLRLWPGGAHAACDLAFQPEPSHQVLRDAGGRGAGLAGHRGPRRCPCCGAGGARTAYRPGVSAAGPRRLRALPGARGGDTTSHEKAPCSSQPALCPWPPVLQMLSHRPAPGQTAGAPHTDTWPAISAFSCWKRNCSSMGCGRLLPGLVALRGLSWRGQEQREVFVQALLDCPLRPGLAALCLPFGSVF